MPPCSMAMVMVFVMFTIVIVMMVMMIVAMGRPAVEMVAVLRLADLLLVTDH